MTKFTDDYWRGYRRALKWASSFLSTKAEENTKDPFVEALLSSLAADVINPDVQEEYLLSKQPCPELLSRLRSEVLQLTDAVEDEAVRLERSIVEVAKEIENKYMHLDMCVAFVSRWAWRTDPPNANNKLSDAERLSAIKWHPIIKVYGQPHIELAEQESRLYRGAVDTHQWNGQTPSQFDKKG